MRVLLVSDFYPPVLGGLEAHVDALAGHLASNGNDVHVATLTTQPQPSSPAVLMHPIRSAAGRLLPHTDAERPFHPPLPDPSVRRALASLIRDISPDIVHAHTWMALSVPRSGDIPLVVTAHDYAFVCQLRTLLRTDGQRCPGPRLPTCVACGSRSGGAARSMLRSVGTIAGRRLLAPDSVLALSDYVRTRIEPALRQTVTVTGGFVAPTRSVEMPDVLPSRPFVIYAGDPGPHKGVDLLLDIWSATDRPATPLVLAVTKPLAGAVPPGVVAVHLDRDGVRSALRRAHVAVVPSRWAEPFGMVAAEALTAGTPVIASDIGGLPEIVRHGIDGMLVPPGDAAALRAALDTLLGEDDRRTAMSVAAREGSQRFRPETVVPRIEAVYRRVLGH